MERLQLKKNLQNSDDLGERLIFARLFQLVLYYSIGIIIALLCESFFMPTHECGPSSCSDLRNILIAIAFSPLLNIIPEGRSFYESIYLLKIYVFSFPVLFLFLSINFFKKPNYLNGLALTIASAIWNFGLMHKVQSLYSV